MISFSHIWKQMAPYLKNLVNDSAFDHIIQFYRSVISFIIDDKNPKFFKHKKNQLLLTCLVITKKKSLGTE